MKQVNSNYGLSSTQLEDVIRAIKRCPEIEKAILFGSRAIGTFKKASDVDIAIMGLNANYFIASKLKHNLEEETYLPFFFDYTFRNRQNHNYYRHWNNICNISKTKS